MPEHLERDRQNPPSLEELKIAKNKFLRAIAIDITVFSSSWFTFLDELISGNVHKFHSLPNSSEEILFKVAVVGPVGLMVASALATTIRALQARSVNREINTRDISYF